MDPYLQGAIVLVASAISVALVLRFFVPLLPGDGREEERRAQAERDAAAKAAE